jgi:hypothetical protein
MNSSDSRRLPAFCSFSVWLIGIFSMLALIAYGYLGVYSRHMADDYCAVKFARGNFIYALWENYLTTSNRFSNFILIALSESVWPGSVSILPALMIGLWVIGITWLLRETSRWLGAGLTKPIAFAFAALIVFFTLLEAPNRYQTLYWRSSMAAHFAPLVFMPFFAIYLLRRISSALDAPPPRWAFPLSFFLAFMLAGFSEPVVLIMVSLLAVSILAAWVTVKTSGRGAVLGLLGWSLAGVIGTLLVMAFAPANSLRLGTPPPALPVLATRSFSYAYEFIRNSFSILPLPALFSVVTPFLIFFGIHDLSVPGLSRYPIRQLTALLVIVPVFSYLLVVASFSPSVYGQGYPVERARFAGQLCLVAGLMIEGAVMGMLSAQLRRPGIRPVYSGLISSALLGITAFYPLRAAWIALVDVPEYRERAKLWDARDAFIRRHAADGEKDIIVPGYPGIYGIKELDDDPNHWVNNCAAGYYNVRSIRAVSFREEDILEYLGE